jgi:23S rRNA pseudouridine2605 synthase
MRLMQMPPKIRLQKFMAECGVASRRAAEKLIAAGKVEINGRVARIGTKIDPASDKVIVNGKLLKQKEKKIYIKLNKPVGVLSACSDSKEMTVVDLIKDVPGRLYPVGRLDMGSEGLMILTNDGELANRLMHPRYEHEKEYEVTVREPLTSAQIAKLEQGIVLDNKKTLPVKIQRAGDRRFRVILREGMKRQIRRMMEAVGNNVSRLKRIRIKNIRLGNLATGKYAVLTTSEIQGLML